MDKETLQDIMVDFLVDYINIKSSLLLPPIDGWTQELDDKMDGESHQSMLKRHARIMLKNNPQFVKRMLDSQITRQICTAGPLMEATMRQYLGPIIRDVQNNINIKSGESKSAQSKSGESKSTQSKI